MYSQELLDSIFADADSLLHYDQPERVDAVLRCVNCHSSHITIQHSDSSCPGSYVCEHCGVVQPGCVYSPGTELTLYRSSNYRRIHHWHERISQFLIQESPIPAHEMLAVAERVLVGPNVVLDKNVLRPVLRSLKLQKYIEKWLQILQAFSGITPPKPGPCLLDKLDELFLQLQTPYEMCLQGERRNFLNYNYVFCRLLQMLDCAEFCIFFPLISKQKLEKLDQIWARMAVYLNWPVTPLQIVEPYSVVVTEPRSVLDRLRTSVQNSDSAAPPPEQWRKVFRKSDLRCLRSLTLETQRRRSSQRARQLRTEERSGLSSRRRVAKRTRSPSQPRARVRRAGSMSE